MRRPCWAALGLALATGCATTSAPQKLPVIDVPDAWQAHPPSVDGRSPELAVNWWSDFGSSDLDAVVETALERNSQIRLAVAQLGAVLAEARISGADLSPTVTAGLAASRRRQNFIGLPVPGSDGGVLTSESTSLGASLDVSWEVDLWGRVRASTRAALADLEASRADLYGARLSIAGQTAKTWLEIAEASRQAALARATVDSFRDTAEQVRIRFDQGLRPSLDLRLARANQANAEALMKQRERQLDYAIRKLQLLTGGYPDRSLVPARDLPELVAPIPASLPAELVARRPDLVAAERRIAAAAQRLRVARRDLYPRLSLTASGGTTSDDLEKLVKGDYRVWNIVGNLLQPLLNGGRLRAAVALADAREKEQLATFVGLAARAYGEVESTLAAEHLLAEREAHLGVAATESRAAEALAKERYRAGLLDFTTVLEAQRRALAADSDRIAVRHERLDNRVNLYLALGGGFERDDATIGRAELSGAKPLIPSLRLSQSPIDPSSVETATP